MFTWIRKLLGGSPSSTSSSAPPTEAKSQTNFAGQKKTQGDSYLKSGELANAAEAYRNAIDYDPQYASAYCGLAFVLKEQKLFDEAGSALAEAIRIAPKSADAHYLSGSVSLACGDVDAAKKHFEIAIASEPEFEAAYLDFCFLLFQSGDFSEAIRIARTGAERIPGSSDLLFFLGNSYHANQQYEPAIQAFEQALSIQSERSDILANLALSLRECGYIEKVIPLYRKILALDPASITTQYHLGSALQSFGKFDEAIACFRQVLSSYPDDLPTLMNMGKAFQSAGSYKEAIPCYQHALAIDPQIFEARYNLAAALQTLGQLEKAIHNFQIVLDIKPDYIDTYINIGKAWHNLGDLKATLTILEKARDIAPESAQVHAMIGDTLNLLTRGEEAVSSYQRALQIDPGLADVHLNLGVALQSLSLFDDAMVSYRTALDINPDSAQGHFYLGTLFHELRRFNDAVASFQQSVQLDPKQITAWMRLGIALKNSQQTEAAITAFEQAMQLDCKSTETLFDLGGELFDLGKMDSAVTCYRRVLELNPEHPEGYYNLGTALISLNRLDEAISSLRSAVSINPNHAGAFNNLGNVLSDLGQFDEALASYREAVAASPDPFAAYSNLLFVRNYIPDQPAATLLAEAIEFGDSAHQKARPYQQWKNKIDTSRRLRVGLVSGDLRHHPVGFFLEGVLDHIGANSAHLIDIVAYSNNESADYLTERIKANCRAWHVVNALSDEELAKKIHDDEIDILLDLAGHNALNRLPMFAWKPAPIQVSWLGYFATTGLREIDYFIADPWAMPAEFESQFVEEIWRLPESRFVFTPPDAELDVGLLPALDNGYITFGCFNNVSKMTDSVVALWSQIMHALPGSRLFLKFRQLDDAGAQRKVIERFAAHGIDASRLILEGHTSRNDYLAAYYRVDMALDPFPYTGGTTTAESLWMGVPVLTLAGDRFIARQGVGLLMNAGLPDWIASTPEDYLARAIQQAGNLSTLSTLRAQLRQQVLASPLFDARRFAEHFETALRGMWKQWCLRHSEGPQSESLP